ncbi:unnamed protein product [Bursaphelenchus xylophilus]|uniref:Coiled-coil domain-containing protein 93 n=1 Tax=Bursaphelenchus xylophilus TaxID=6326 RepID=A0A1I7S998_BURXY|nr:unnamed protein product [Bursaphelenchus xylophilus]CAG9100465.1 unnamed protein product [Bursaphelenchus xylophilus]
MESTIESHGWDGQFTVQQDEEQYAKMSQILELLVSAGYFRAKIDGLSAFDKIVGGMVWCIQLCAEVVDVDLLYSENSSIGQKIALTQNIVKVLPNFKCPHSIEPHQIQGLDCINIYPVVKWLVKEAIEAKEKYGDEILRYASSQFKNTGWAIDNEQPTSSISSEVERAKPVRRMARANKEGFKNIKDDVRSTLLEFGLEVEDVVKKDTQFDDDLGREKRKELEESFLRDLQITEQLRNELVEADPLQQKRVSARKVNSMIDSSALEKVAKDSEGLKLGKVEETEEDLAEMEKKLLGDLEKLKKENEEMEKVVEEEENKVQQISEKQQYLDDLLTNTDPEIIKQVSDLLDQCQELRTGESEFKRECRRQIEEAEAEIERLQQLAGPDPEKIKELREENSQLEEELAQINQEIFYLSKKLDSTPTQIELNQYQRRFVELYNLVTAKHLEARRLYMLNNHLIDACKFTKKEIDLLMSIDDQKELALKEAYKSSFVENLRKIVSGVDESLDKIMKKKAQTQQAKDSSFRTLQDLRKQKRLYIKTIADFQQECQKNERLRELLKERDG